jgi:hypothetical protein
MKSTATVLACPSTAPTGKDTPALTLLALARDDNQGRTYEVAIDRSTIRAERIAVAMHAQANLGTAVTIANSQLDGVIAHRDAGSFTERCIALYDATLAPLATCPAEP